MKETVNWDSYLSTRRIAAYTDRALISPVLHGDLLDVGCGFGEIAGWAAAELGCRAIGIDPSAEAVAEATRQFPDARFLVGTAEALPFPDASFDTLVSLEVVEHLPDPERFFSEAARVLRPGGALVVQTPNYPIKRLYDVLYWLLRRKSDPWDDPTHVTPFSFRRMRRLAIAAGFRPELLVGRNVLGEGKLPFLARAKRGPIAPFLSQKMILIAQAAAT